MYAAAPSPTVKEAIARGCRYKFLLIASSIIGEICSPATTNAYLDCPLLILDSAINNPVNIPAHALETSNACAPDIFNSSAIKVAKLGDKC